MPKPNKYRPTDAEVQKRQEESTSEMWERYLRMPGGQAARELLAKIRGMPLDDSDLGLEEDETVDDN